MLFLASTESPANRRASAGAVGAQIDTRLNGLSTPTNTTQPYKANTRAIIGMGALGSPPCVCGASPAHAARGCAPRPRSCASHTLAQARARTHPHALAHTPRARARAHAHTRPHTRPRTRPRTRPHARTRARPRTHPRARPHARTRARPRTHPRAPARTRARAGDLSDPLWGGRSCPHTHFAVKTSLPLGVPRGTSVTFCLMVLSIGCNSLLVVGTWYHLVSCRRDKGFCCWKFLIPSLQKRYIL